MTRDTNVADADEFGSSFAMHELSRLLSTAARTTAPGGVRLRPSAQETPAALSTDRFYGGVRTNRERTKPKPKPSSSDDAPALNNASRTTHVTRRTVPRTFNNATQRQKKSNVTAAAQSGSTSSARRGDAGGTSGSGNLDRLLALHLAEDLNGAVNIDTSATESRRTGAETSSVFASDLGNLWMFVSVKCA